MLPRTGISAIAVFVAVPPAYAHDGHLHGADWTASLTLDAAVTMPLLASAALFSIGVGKLWRRAGIGRGVHFQQVACFSAGWLVLLGALVSPLHALGETLFSAHMAEHELLMAVAAPLLVMARPGNAMLWAFPAAWRRGMGGLVRPRSIRSVWRWLTDPVAATILHAIAIWAWHVPALFDAALESEAVHWLQHLSFFVTALLFWWALIHGRSRERGYGAAVFYLFATAVHSGFLGVLLTFAPVPIYAGQSAAAAWGLTRLEDQQLAGLIMWIPGGSVYALAALVFAGMWIRASGSQAFAPEPRRADPARFPTMRRG